MPCYVLGTLTITDIERYRFYMKGFGKMFGQFNGRLLAVDDAPTVLEGSWDRSRVAILEFSSREEAERWYRSDEYQKLSADFRWPASSGDLYIVEAMNPKL